MYSRTIKKIIGNASKSLYTNDLPLQYLGVLDGIDITAFPSASAGFSSIEAIGKPVIGNSTAASNVTKIHTQVHVVPDWYHALVPTTDENPAPAWDIRAILPLWPATVLIFDLICVKHSIINISSPGSVVYPGSEATAAALARLLNEVAIRQKHLRPPSVDIISTVACSPGLGLSDKEAEYALDHFGALGVGVLSNHEGKYLGNSVVKPYLTALNGKHSSRETVFVHPTDPVINVNDTLLIADPNINTDGLVEFYFETARTIMDLTISQTLHNFNFTKLNFIIPRVEGAHPAIEDRYIKSFPALEASSKIIYNTRFFWDSAGPTYFDQVKGLLGYGVSTSQLIFGRDYPYARFPYEGAIEAVASADFLGAEYKERAFSLNAESLFEGMLS